jgi:hypothetical protein
MARAGIPEPDLLWYGRILTATGGTPVRLTSGTLVWTIEPTAGGAPWELRTSLTNINDQFSYLLRVPCESPEPTGTPTAGTVVLTTPAISYHRLTVTLDGQPLTIKAAPSTFAPVRADRGLEERIDLVLSVLPPDSDGDGMSDAWELEHFGPAGALPNDDADGDGKSNLHEYQAGTNPRDSRSVFAVVEISQVPGGTRIEWSSEPNKLYRVRRASSLLSSPAGYAILQDAIDATPPLNAFLDTTTANNPRLFYIIEVVN